MKIGFNVEAIAKLNNTKIIKDKSGNIKKIYLDEETKELFKKLREQNHEAYMFINVDKDLSVNDKKKIKEQIKKQNKFEKKYEPRIVLVNNKGDYNDTLKRNEISVNINDNNSEMENVKTQSELDKYVNSKIEQLRTAMLDMDKKPTNVPSEDKFWLKHQTVEDYRDTQEMYSPYERLKRQNIDFADEIFIQSSDFGTKISYEQAFKAIDRTADAFLANGIKQGSKVPVVMTTSPETFIIIYALFKAKATVVPLFPKLTETEIVAKLKDIDYDYIVAHDIFYSKIKASIKNDSKAIMVPLAYSASKVKKVYFENVLKKKMGYEKVKYDQQFIGFNDFLKDSPKYEGEIDTSYDENYEAVELFTGGTFKSKGVTLTAKNLEAAHQGYPNVNYPILRDDKFACFLPINHVFGLVSILYSAAAWGAKMDTVAQINLKEIDKLFSKDKITIFAGIPTMVDSIINNKNLTSDDLQQLRYFILGGAKTVDQLKTDVKNFGDKNNINIDIIDGLGQTETSTAYLYNNILSINDEVKIVKPGTDEELNYKEHGEICVSGPNVMKKYDSLEETDKAFYKDANGKIWFHTGDIGYNDNGKIYASGRLSRTLKVNGELICAEDLESIITQCEAVKDCCIVGKPDEKKGSLPVAFITLREGYAYNDSVKKLLEKFYAKNLVYYSRPKITKCLNELPKTNLGKPDFKQLQLLADCIDMPYETSKKR